MIRPRLATAHAVLKGWGCAGAAGTLGLVLLLTLVGPQRAPVLSTFHRSDLSVPTGGLLGLLVALAVLAGTREPSGPLTVTSARPVAVIRSVRVLVLSTVAVVLITAGAHSTLRTAVASVAAFVGEQLVMAALVGRTFSWAAPMTHTLAAITLGATGDGRIAVWAWFLDPHVSATGEAVSCLLLAAGLWTWTPRSRRLTDAAD